MKPPVLLGASRPNTMRKRVECPSCRGRGERSYGYFDLSRCAACEGHGYFLRSVPLPPADPAALARSLAVVPHETRAQRRERQRREIERAAKGGERG